MIASPFLASSAPTIWGESVFWMVAERPIFAAIAWAMSISKPTACWVAGSIDSWGGEGVAGGKGRGPRRARVVGGGRFGGGGRAVGEGARRGGPLPPPRTGTAAAP